MKRDKYKERGEREREREREREERERERGDVVNSRVTCIYLKRW